MERSAASYERYDGILEKNVRSLGLGQPAVLTFNPFVAAFCPLNWAGTVTYYAMDDWASFPPVEPWWPRFREAYDALREKRVRIISVSEELAVRVAGGGQVVVLPNGIDGILWGERRQPPPSFAALPRPIVAYAGTIDKRLNLELIEKVSNEADVATIAFIGPIVDEAVLKILPCHSEGRTMRTDVTGCLGWFANVL